MSSSINAGRIAIYGAVAVALLLVGASVGLLIGLPSSTNADNGPSAVDIGFAQTMAMHHTQAVTMANYTLLHSSDTEIKQLAFDISTSQQEQVGRMHGWLMLWDKPENPTYTTTAELMGWMMLSSHDGMSMSTMSSQDAAMMKTPTNGAPMAGMASASEMSKLQSLTGKELEVYFLQLMIRHHKGGSAMGKYAAANATTAAVRTLANSMVISQTAEVTTMTNMLTARGSSPIANNW